MLCPCCGDRIQLGARSCSCGARIVGKPLDQPPIKVRRFGPAITSVASLGLAIASSLLFSYWMALSGIVVALVAHRAIRLAKREPDLYAGQAAAATVFAITLLAGIGASIYFAAHIPDYIQQRRLRQEAATRAAMLHLAGLLEEYKSKHGSYPTNIEALKKEVNEPLPLDYWEKSLRYQSYTEAIAAREVGAPDHIKRRLSGESDELEVGGITFNNFELRSAGPDGKMGTDDDIIMRDGIFFTSSEIKKAIAPASSKR
jgi:type II secretory pathway pseudopilin PulG